MIDDGMLERLENLAKLSLKEEEKAAIRSDLNRLLGYIDRMRELDTTEGDALIQPIPFSNVFRQDQVTNAEDRDNLMKNAPVREKEMFVVPKSV